MVRIRLVQFTLNPPGGGSAVSAWMLQALQAAGWFTRLTCWERPDLEKINAYYGTCLRADRLEVELVPLGLRCVDRLLLALRFLPGSSDLQAVWRSHSTMAWFRRKASKELLISASDELNLGRRSLQYVHYPYRAPTEPRPWWRRFLLGLLCQFSGWRATANLANRTLTNSRWTGGVYRALYGGPLPTVLYPPVRARSGLPWDERRPDFLCVGRLHPDKELEKVVSIVAGVRARGYRVQLTLMGSQTSGGYTRRIQALARTHSSWLRVLVDPDESRFEREWKTHRYGLHGMTREHFGIAVAEQVLSGMLPFVPNQGGQVEIVTEPRLQYRDASHAVDQICKVLELEAAGQQQLVAQLSARAQRFTPDRFCREFLRIVCEELAGHTK